MPSACMQRPGRSCRAGRVTVERLGSDACGRTLAMVTVNRQDAGKFLIGRRACPMLTVIGRRAQAPLPTHLGA